METALRPFQRRFLKRALAPDVDTACLSLPRGGGKSWLAGYILKRCLTPDDPLHEPGKEYILGAASIEQARLVYRFVREALEPVGGYRFLDSATRIGITHKSTNTRLRIISSNAKTAMGLVGVPLVVLDEPGSFEVVGGELMHDAMQTAQGKVGSPLRVIYIGTLAPSRSGWWIDMVADGSVGSTYVQALQADRKKWDNWREIKRVNPLTAISARFRKKLIEERDAARADSRKRARFLSYRLNLPTADEASTLLTVEDWEHVVGRPVGDVKGKPIVGVDLGGGRAFSAACAIWPSGRIEAVALTGGVPNVCAQEKRDRVKGGTYQALVDAGTLVVDEGMRVPRPSLLVDYIVSAWRPRVVVCDRFRLNDLIDAAKGRVRVSGRVTRWSEATSDIRALRKQCKDGPLSCDHGSRKLIEASLLVSTVKADDGGSMKLVKSKSNCARDDVCAALLLAAGGVARLPKKKKAAFALCTPRVAISFHY